MARIDITAPVVRPAMQDAQLRARASTRAPGEDVPEIADRRQDRVASRSGRAIDDRGGLDL